jgi:prepilin-type N-terminal cleavage/methylation domain-containing protein
MKMNDNKGFTLLEMILVIFLITLIVGISAVVFSRSLPSQKVDATAREIMAIFRQARSNAITGGKWQILTVEIEGKTFGIEEGGVTHTIPENVSIRVIDPLYGEVVVGGYRFVFAPSGVTEGGTIVLSAGKKVVTLEIDPIVGAVISRHKE